MKRTLPPFRGWSAKPWAGEEFLAPRSVNCHLAQGRLRADRGYRILKQIQTAAFGKGGGSFSHVHTDGTVWPFYWYNGAWYRLDTGGAIDSLVTGLGDYFVPEVVHFPAPGGVSAGFVGDNSKAYGFRKSTDIEAYLWDMDVPGGSFSVTTPVGGTLPAGTYHVAVTQIDTAGSRTVESGPIFQTSIAAALNDKIVLDLAGVNFAARGDKYRVYLSVGADAATAYFQFGADTAKATTTFEITSTTVGTAIPHRGTLYQKSKLQISGVKSACRYKGRLLYGSEGSPYVGFSERDDTNHYYSTNLTDSFHSGVTALAEGDDCAYVFTATSIWQITGDLGRNEDFTLRAAYRCIEPGFGCTARGSVVSIPEVGVFFMSNFGPCAIVNGTVVRLGHPDFADLIPRLDLAYWDRCTAAFNHRLRQYVCFVPRLTNSNRISDGAANAGICDLGIRWDLDRLGFSPPLHFEVTHVRNRANTTVGGGTSLDTIFAATGAHGDALQMDRTNAAGKEGDVSAYVGEVPSTFTTTTAILAGTSLGIVQGMGITLRYPSTDSAVATETVQRTVKTVTEAAGNTTIGWDGAVPTPSGTYPTIRVGDYIRRARRGYLGDPERPTAQTKLNHHVVAPLDIVGMDARS